MPFSNDISNYNHVTLSRHAAAEYLLKDVCALYGVEAALLCRIYPNNSDITVVLSHGVPREPFNGSEKGALIDVIRECSDRFAKAHSHNLNDQNFVSRLQRYNKTIPELRRAWYVPLTCESQRYICVAFLGQGADKGKLNDFISRVSLPLILTNSDNNIEELTHHIKVTDQFIKESGHDIASSVQASIAKINLIVNRTCEGEQAVRKAAEIEQEIMGAYHVSESLGIVTDNNYKITNPEDLDLVDASIGVLNRFRAEAKERNIRLCLENGPSHIPFWGDKRALEQAIGHLISNAIKYSYGGSDVTIKLYVNNSEATIEIINRGILLPPGEEVLRIWDFGFRGAEAKQLHVNGSGIGLFSVRKIVIAHKGRSVGMCDENGIACFKIIFPPVDVLKSELRLLL